MAEGNITWLPTVGMNYTFTRNESNVLYSPVIVPNTFPIGYVKSVSIDSGTGKVTLADNFTPGGGSFTVAAHTSSSATLQDPTTSFGADPPLVVYRKSGDIYTYIGCAGLTDGWSVRAYLDTGSVAVILYVAP